MGGLSPPQKSGELGEGGLKPARSPASAACGTGCSHVRHAQFSINSLDDNTIVNNPLLTMITRERISEDLKVDRRSTSFLWLFLFMLTYIGFRIGQFSNNGLIIWLDARLFIPFNDI